MAKDYKDAGKKPAKSGGNKGTPGPIWLLGGFALGVATTVILRIGVLNPQAQQQVEAARAAAAAAPVAAAPEAEKPKYDFYNMLPKFEVVVPETEKVVNGTTPAVTPPGTYVLQAGSFRTAADADRLRAQLALVGIEARIEQVTIDAKDTWHRVRIGPLKEGEELERIKARLADNKLTALVIRVGD